MRLFAELSSRQLMQIDGDAGLLPGARAGWRPA
jgi:hypothetical protein